MSSDQLTHDESEDVDDQDAPEDVDGWPGRQLQTVRRKALSLTAAINEADVPDGFDLDKLLEAVGTLIWTVVDILQRSGRLVLSSWPLVLLGLLSVQLWFSFGTSYFEAAALSWTTALAMYGLTTTLYLSHRVLSRYWWLYNRVRFTSRS